MDRENFNAIIARYLEKFDETNSAGEEWFKWEAIDCFQKNWDIDAPGFAQMFSRAVKQFSVLIDTTQSSPVAGLKTLIGQPGEAEIVHKAFRELYADDGGDLELRQKKAEAFVQTINERIEIYWPGSHKYPQSMRSALLFLTMRFPAENYILFWSRAYNWANYAEYGDDFGSGASFSLPKFYRMCDEIREEIENSSELQQCNERRMETAKVHIDDHYHTLVYDIIYCATCYDLYKDIPTYDAASAKKRIERAAERAELERLKETALAAKTALSEYKTLDCLPVNLAGHTVTSKSFGTGTVASHESGRVTVAFASGEKTFLYPDAFLKKHLIPEPTDAKAIEESVSHNAKLKQLESEAANTRTAYRKKEGEFQKKWLKSVHNELINKDDE